MENPATNATTPNDPPHPWVPEPKQRGTFGIISLCLSTMIICIWSTLHFNIPIKRYTATRRFFIQVSWMFIALLAPEVLLFLAINERINAGILLRKVLKSHPHLVKPGMLAGVCDWIRGRVKSKDVSAQCQSSVICQLIVIEQKRYNLIREQAYQPHFGLVHAFYATMGGFAFYGPYDDNNPTVEESLFQISTNPHYTAEVPKFETLVYIMEHFPHIFTDITEESILDQAASSSLSKALLIVQVAWFCTNCASRLSQRLPLSLLEVSTAAHAFCTLLTYFVWWSKPLNVAAPTIMREKGAREVYALLKCSDDEYEKALEMAQKRAAAESSTLSTTHESEKVVLAAGALQQLLPAPKRPPSSDFKNGDHMLSPGSFANKLPRGGVVYSEYITIAISPTLYGLVHFLAWGDRFPTPLERLLWWVSSLVVTCSGLVEAIALLIGKWGDYNEIHDSIIVVLGMSMMIIPFAHIIASGFLIVESFRQLSFLDSAAYQLPSWSNYWPHFL